MSQIRPMTRQGLAARRRNAKKSTGPRTPAGKSRSSKNARKQGIYVQSLQRTMLALGESPAELARFLERLIADHRPATTTEMMLVEEIAMLGWERQRLDRAQWGLLARQIEEAELERWQHAREVEKGSLPQSETQTFKTGLRRAPDSRSKFDELLSHLDILIDKVKRRDFSEDWAGLLQYIYGEDPEPQGAQIVSLFRHFFERHEAGNPEESEEDKGFYDLLRVTLFEAQRDVAEEYEKFFLQHLEITPSLRDALLAPQGPQWGITIRHKNSIDRQIERKLRLLVQLQRNRLRALPSLSTSRKGGKI